MFVCIINETFMNQLVAGSSCLALLTPAVYIPKSASNCELPIFRLLHLA